VKDYVFASALCVAVSFLISSRCLTAQQICGSGCDIRGNPPPPSLQDDGGHGADFQFHHLSDAGGVTNPDGSKIRRYRYSIWNKHKDKVLDAEWSDVGVTFQSILPGCCALMTRESCKNPSEDAQAVIRYGPAKTFAKPASAYLPTAAQPGGQPPDHPGHRLRGNILGTFRWNNEPIQVEVAFETTATLDGSYSYSVLNKGHAELNFEMQALTRFWSRRNMLEKALALSTWTRSELNSEVFRLRPEQTLRVQGVGAGPIVEGASDLTIFAPDAKSVLARATVSVWEPSASR